MSLFSVLIDLALTICFIVAFFGLTLFKSSEKSIRFFVGLMVSHFGFQCFAPQITLIMGENVQFMKSVKFIYILFEYLFFYFILFSKKYKRIISVIFSFGTIILIIHYLDSFTNPNNSAIQTILNNTMVLLSCFVYFFFMMKKISLQPLLRQWKFIIVTGFFVYALGSTASHVMLFYAFEVGLENRDMGIMNILIYTLELCIFFWGLWVYRAELKSAKRDLSEAIQ